MALLIYTLSVRLLLCALLVDAVHSRSSLGIYKMIFQMYIFTFVSHSFVRQTRPCAKHIVFILLQICRSYSGHGITVPNRAIRRSAGLSINLTDGIVYTYTFYSLHRLRWKYNVLFEIVVLLLTYTYIWLSEVTKSFTIWEPTSILHDNCRTVITVLRKNLEDTCSWYQ